MPWAMEQIFFVKTYYKTESFKIVLTRYRGISILTHFQTKVWFSKDLKLMAIVETGAQRVP